MTGSSGSAYNPLAIETLAQTVAHELLEQVCGPLPPIAKFNGAGVYAIYYRGALPVYAPISQANTNGCVQPIYVGKTTPSGGRKGVAVVAGMRGQTLFNRLTEHADSIRDASGTLLLEDFHCRFLAVEDPFIDIAERRLIYLYKPVWNACLDGFGNHAPGGGRTNQKRSGWDEFHPGRPWAAGLQLSKHTAEEWRGKIGEYLAAQQMGTLPEVTVVDDGDDDPETE